MISLYPDQDEFVDDIREAFRSHQAVLAQAPTGYGKTIVASYIAKGAAAKKRRVTFTVHRKNLITQTAVTFEKFGVPYGIIAAGHRQANHELVQIASIQSLVRRLDTAPPVDLLIVDECHLACSASWSKVLKFYRERGARLLGNTATAARLDGRPLSEHFDTIVVGPSMQRLIDAGRLSDYNIIAPNIPDLSGVRKLGGDYRVGDLEQVINDQHLVGNAVKHYKKWMPGRRALAFCVSIAASEITAQRFSEAGVPAAHIDGTTPDERRQEIIHDFADGRILVLCNVDLVTTGFDLSSQVGREVPVEGIILLRPTASVVLFLQMVGRGMRYKPDPAIILDHSGATLAHGLPCQEREWSLDGRTKKDSNGSAPSLRHCPECFSIYRATLGACPLCGWEPKVEPRILDETDEELVEIDKLEHRRLRVGEERRARGLGALVALAVERGYAPGWAARRQSYRTDGMKGSFKRLLNEENQIRREMR